MYSILLYLYHHRKYIAPAPTRNITQTTNGCIAYIQLAAYLVQKPYVIMFDEPFDYCSDEYIDMFLRVLNEEAEGHIVIVTTGIFAMAKRIAKDVLVLSNGEINEVTYEMIDIPEIKKAIFDILGELEE